MIFSYFLLNDLLKGGNYLFITVSYSCVEGKIHQPLSGIFVNAPAMQVIFVLEFQNLTLSRCCRQEDEETTGKEKPGRNYHSPGFPSGIGDNVSISQKSPATR
jgi:hypothetical protein